MSFGTTIDDYTPIEIPATEGYESTDVLNIWKKITNRFGMRNLRLPLITYDEKFPILFGITLKWRVMLNMIHVPEFIPDDEKLWWIEYCPIHHELGHYHVSPYDGKTLVEYLYIIQEEWDDCTKDQAFYVMNMFTDILVNFFLTDRYPHDFPKAQQYWFRSNNEQVQNNGFRHSHSWRIFTKIHELKWWTKCQDKIPKREEEFAQKIYGMLNAGENRQEILRHFTREGKKFFKMDTEAPSITFIPQPSPNSNQSQKQQQGSSLSIGKMKDDEEGKEGESQGTTSGDKNDASTSKKDGQGGQNADGDGNGNENGTTGDKNKTSKNSSQGSGIFSKIQEKQHGNTSQSQKNGQKHNHQNIKHNGKSTPFDMLIMGGDPYEEKYPSKVSNTPSKQEKDQAISHLMKISRCRSASALKLMVKVGLADSDMEAKRIWLRRRARELLRYEPHQEKEVAEIQDGLTRWRWTNPIQELSILKSITSNPAFIYPPNARKINYVQGFRGKRMDNYADCLIIIDSSGSMGGLSHSNTFTTPYDFACLSAFGVLHASAKKNVQIACINFSGHSRELNWLKVSHESVLKMENFLMRPIGGGTVFPVRKIKEMAKKSKKCILTIITDAELANFQKAIEYFESIKKRHQVVMFFIDPSEEMSEYVKKDIEALEKVDVQVFRIASFADLPKVVIKKASQMW